tara:strand:+ start:6237 stop:6434 length:198 start_codon:yes stop_codon:yes gene_type:complete
MKKYKAGGKAISKSKQKGLAKLAKKKPSVVSTMGYNPKKMVAAMGGLKKAMANLEKMMHGGRKKK